VSKGDTRAAADRDHLATRQCRSTQIDRGRRSPGRPLVLPRSWQAAVPCGTCPPVRNTAWMPCSCRWSCSMPL